MDDLIKRPLEAVRQLFQQAGGNNAGDWGVRAAFEAALLEPAVLAQVPLVSCSVAYPGSRVPTDQTVHASCAGCLCNVL
jgi:hypothetical protein